MCLTSRCSDHFERSHVLISTEQGCLDWLEGDQAFNIKRVSQYEHRKKVGTHSFYASVEVMKPIPESRHMHVVVSVKNDAIGTYAILNTVRAIDIPGNTSTLHLNITADNFGSLQSFKHVMVKFKIGGVRHGCGKFYLKG